MSIERDELEEIIEKAVTRTLERIGLDVENPRELQEDFAQLRQWREAKAQTKTALIYAFFGVVVPGILAVMWLGLKGMWSVP